MLPNWQYEELCSTIITLSGAGCEEVNGEYQHQAAYETKRDFERHPDFDAFTIVFRRLQPDHNTKGSHQEHFQLTLNVNELMSVSVWAIERLDSVSNSIEPLYFQKNIDAFRYLPSATEPWRPAAANLFRVPTITLRRMFNM